MVQHSVKFTGLVHVFVFQIAFAMVQMHFSEILSVCHLKSYMPCFGTGPIKIQRANVSDVLYVGVYPGTYYIRPKGSREMTFMIFTHGLPFVENSQWALYFEGRRRHYELISYPVKNSNNHISRIV